MEPTQNASKDQDLALSPREQAKQDRRDRILSAAEALILEAGNTDFSMSALAHRATVSVPTPYNLLGSKSEILYALLDRSLNPIFARRAASKSSRQPFMGVLSAARFGVEAFVARRDLYQPLYRFLLGVPDSVSRPRFIEKARSYWDSPLQLLLEQGYLPGERTKQQLARLIFTQFIGALELWIQNDLDDDQFSAHIEVGVATALLGYANGDEHRRVLIRLGQLERRLPAQF